MNRNMPTLQRACAEIERQQVIVRGAVQGVGFRPFVFRLATDLGLNGWVSNTAQGVFIEVEGESAALNVFVEYLMSESPPHARIESLNVSRLPLVGFSHFEVRQSEETGAKTALILPDLATCHDCLRELFDPKDRRYRYPFINCTNCGPRFSIIEALPYDRMYTTMRHFPMCLECQAEYETPLDRRFHAQPNACPNCGPQLALWDANGAVLAVRDEALWAAAEALRCGRIVAIKGLGGFQLVVDARDDQAVQRLRQRKLREAKPFALLFPSLPAIHMECTLTPLEEALLDSAAAPIVLVQRAVPSNAPFSVIAPSVAPNNPYLGAMLPHTPLHHLLMAELSFPVVATSGNRSDEPICTDEHDALDRLRGIADVLLVHNRPIAHYVDDSVVRVVMNTAQVLRRARGYAPLPLTIAREPDAPPVLALGGHLKNSVALAVGNNVFISQHIGDLETALAYQAFTRMAADLPNVYAVQPQIVACDAHPDYLSTQYAKRLTQWPLAVQHHYAHVLSCMAEHTISAPVLGVAWDGTGYGGDGTLWGGEFLRINERGFLRVAHLRPFKLPGSKAAIREPRRSALGMLHEHVGDALWDMLDLAPVAACTPQERTIFGAMLQRNLNSPHTFAVGRLFDAVASIIGLRQHAQFEGQAAMELEFLQSDDTAEQGYQMDIESSANGLVLDWRPLLDALLRDLRTGIVRPVIAARFHHTLVTMIVTVARQVGIQQVVLSGGCFQNRMLTERTTVALRDAGFQPYWHQQIPPNDGGIALGQVLAVARDMA
jgi:hydrogenase maturation protein HypF